MDLKDINDAKNIYYDLIEKKESLKDANNKINELITIPIVKEYVELLSSLKNDKSIESLKEIRVKLNNLKKDPDVKKYISLSIFISEYTEKTSSRKSLINSSFGLIAENSNINNDIWAFIGKIDINYEYINLETNKQVKLDKKSNEEFQKNHKIFYIAHKNEPVTKEKYTRNKEIFNNIRISYFESLLTDSNEYFINNIIDKHIK